MKTLHQAAMAALLLAASVVIAADQRYVAASSLYVRSNPQGFFVGTLFQSEGFNRADTSGDYAWGYAGGAFQGCGWVETRWTAPGGSTPTCHESSGPSNVHGAASRQLLLSRFASQINDYIPGASLPLLNGGSPVRVNPGVQTGVFGNYRDGRVHNVYGLVDSSVPMAWRWVSKDGLVVAVNTYPGESRSAWMFVPRNALPAKLPYSDGIER